MEDLFARLGCKLKEVPVGVSHQNNSGRGVAELIQGSPTKSIDWSWLFHACVDLRDLVVSAKIEDSDDAVAVSTGGHGIFVVELGDHELCWFGDDSFHHYFVLERNLLDYPMSLFVYLWLNFGFLFCIQII